MDTVLHVLGISLLASGCIGCLAVLPLGAPGTVLMVGIGALYGWATGFTTVTWTTLAWLGGLAATAEVIELLAGGRAAAGTRPSWRVTFSALGGSFAGGLLGAPFFFGLGALGGALLGAAAGAALAVTSEGGSLGLALRTGQAAFKGRLLGFVAKGSIALVMAAILLSAAW